MEVKQLPAMIVLFVTVGMIIGVGLIVLLNFGDAARASTQKLDDRVNLSIANVTKSLTYDELVTTVTPSVVNTSGTALSASSYVIDYTAGTIRRIAGGTIPAVNGMYNVTYNYYRDTSTTTAMDNVSSAVSTISSTWLGLIVTVLALALILTLVLSSFGGR